MAWTVYEHITPSGKRYIGITSKKPEERWKNGNGYKDTLFGRAIEKYKWENIQHNIISTDLTEKEAKWLENYLICYYWTFVGFSDCNGYNCTLGGDGQVGFKHTEDTKHKIIISNIGKHSHNKGIPRDSETKRKISESHKGIHPTKETRTRISESHKGIHPTKETRTRMSESHKGKHNSEEHNRKISESKKGDKNYIYGKHHKPETRKKMSEVKKGKPSNTKGKHWKLIDGKRHYE